MRVRVMYTYVRVRLRHACIDYYTYTLITLYTSHACTRVVRVGEPPHEKGIRGLLRNVTSEIDILHVRRQWSPSVCMCVRARVSACQCVRQQISWLFFELDNALKT